MKDESRFHTDLRARLARLSEAQRHALLARLNSDRGVDRHARRSGGLVACVVPNEGFDPDDLRHHVRERLADHMVPGTIVVTDALPRTNAGKLDRKALPDIERNSADSAEPDSFAEPSTETEETLAEIWSDVLGLDAISIHESFFEVGGDSLLSIRILARANRAGLNISPEEFFEHPTIAEQAKLADRSAPAVIDQDNVIGSIPLTPIQHWFFEKISVDLNHWNQSPLLRVATRVDGITLERAVQGLMNHHDALRARFIVDGGTVRQEIMPSLSEPPVEWIESSTIAESELGRLIESTADRVHRDFDLSSGPLIRFVYFSLPQLADDRLLIVAHHLIVDAVSWQILFEDLETLLEILEAGKKARLPEKTTSFGRWTQRLADYANRPAVAEEIAYWARLSHADIPRDVALDLAENTVERAFSIERSIGPQETDRLVTAVPKSLHCQVNEALLAALALTLREWTGRDVNRFDLEGHGREAIFDGVDLSRTVGWLTTVYPVVLDLKSVTTALEAVTAVKAQIKSIPARGIGYGLLRHLSDADHASLKKGPDSLLCFNYLGRIDRSHGDPSRLLPVDWNVGHARSERGCRAFLVDVDVRIENGRLIAVWTANERFHERATIGRLAEHFFGALREITAMAESDDISLTADDFPLAGLDNEEFENLSKLLEGSET